MRQINLNVTPEFEQDLEVLMKTRRIATESEAICKAVHEAVGDVKHSYDFSAWLGMANEWPENPDRQFLNEDDLW